MSTLTPGQAIEDALAEEMRRDARVITFGEGVATKGHALVREFGAARVRNTPLAEGIIAGTAVGAAATGLRPVIDMLFAPFLCYAMEELINSAGKLRYLSGGQFSFPLVAVARTGSGWAVGGQHNHNIEAWFVHAPGIKVVMPSAAADFKGLLKSAIRDDNPVMFFADIGLLHAPGDVPDGDVLVPIGRASVVRDLRTLKPLDEAAILASVEKTGRAVVVHEASGICGVAAEVGALIAEKAFSSLKAPVVRLTGPDAPPPASYPLEQAYSPKADRIVGAVQRLAA